MTGPADVHDAFDLVEEQFSEALDESLDPAGPGVLYDYVAAMGLPAGSVALDAGCGEGEHAIELSRRFGLRVTGIDPVARCVEAARRATRPGGTVTFETGTAEDLPAASDSVDLIWCRDVLCLVEDLGRAYREFRRVLRPGGRAVLLAMEYEGLKRTLTARRWKVTRALRVRMLGQPCVLSVWNKPG